MRRIAALAVLALLLMTGTASAATNTLSFDIAMQMSETPSTNKPAPLAYKLMQDVGTNPPGQQPDSAGQFTFYFDKNIASNGRYFPGCTRAQVDGQPEIPDACKPAIVGSGVATVYAGSPGTPISNSVREDLTVTVLNGSPAGDEWLLYLRSGAGAPVYLRRVIPGTVIPLSEAYTDKYSFAVQFDVPLDLQSQLGLSIAMTKLVLNIPSYMHAVQFEGSYYSASFLVIKACDGSISGQDTVFFGFSGGYYGYPGYPAPYPTPYPNPNYGLIAEGTAPCQVGPGFADYPPFYPPGSNDYPLLPGQDGSTGGGGDGGGGGGDGGGGSGGGENPPPTENPPPGGTPGGGTPPPTTPPPPGIRGGGGKPKTVTVARDGSFTLPGVTVACPAGTGFCTVDGDAIAGAGASKVAVLAKVKFRLAAGKSSGVKLRLTKAGKRLLKRKKLLKLTVRLRVREANGVQTKRNIKTRVKARKPRH